MYKMVRKQVCMGHRT